MTDAAEQYFTAMRKLLADREKGPLGDKEEAARTGCLDYYWANMTTEERDLVEGEFSVKEAK